MRALAPRTVLAVALAHACLGCSPLSDASFSRTTERIEARNEARRSAAFADFRRRGYELVVDPDLRFASLSADDRTGCLEPIIGGAPKDEMRFDPERAMSISLGALTPEGAPPAASTTATAIARDACAFFEGSGDGLDVTRSDGTHGRIVRTAGARRLARGPDGVLVLVDVRPRVVDRSKARVDRTCNRMPKEQPTGLESGVPIMVRWGPEAPLASVVVQYDVEVLEMECDRYVD